MEELDPNAHVLASLQAWELAWRGDSGAAEVLPASLLIDPSVEVLAGRLGGDVVAGAVLNDAAGVIGVSNVFSPADRLSDAWSGLMAVVGVTRPGRAVVGYEAGENLAAARGVGFRPIGHLRIWLRS